MIDSKGRVCEYDGYKIPEKGEDTPENRTLRAKAMEAFKAWATKIKEERTE